jgi:hypothetical protein
LEALEGRECPSTLKVTNLADFGKGTLRYEIAQAQSNDTIVFADKLNGGTIALNSGEQLYIGKNLTIQGPGAGLLTVSSDIRSHTVRIFEVGRGATVTLSGLTVSAGGGRQASSVFGNYFDGDGGGVLNFGTLTISGCTLTGNTAYYGGAIYNGNTLTLRGCTVSSNSASDYYGGGLYNAGNANVQNSTLSGNTAYEGGGIYNAASATLTVSGGALSDNRYASYGGGIYTIGTATVSGCTLSGNTASQGGGGIYNGSTQMELTVLNSIFSGNQPDNIFGPYSDGGGNSFN